ncbi:MAG: hypothetical protein IIC54_09470 [Proteobacteria bacterium]|nr:hypothetical protein [Pseudomonadota bacterium]
MAFPLIQTARTLAISTAIFGLSLSLAAEQQTDDATNATVRIEIRIENRKLVGDQVIRLTQGQRVEIVWITDEAVELHMHGYDIRVEISPDGPATMTFTAHATGRFPVTSHGFGDENGHGHVTLAYIEINPIK